jgi:hypothetical protein
MLAVAEVVYGNAALYEQVMTNAANLSPNLFLELGQYFQDRIGPDKASQYYDEGEARGAESLDLAAHARWRIDYYLGKGDRAKARQIADAAGEVYSAAGLQAKADFFEKTEDYTNALYWYSQIQERYDDANPLKLFCLRTRGLTTDPQFNQEAEEYLSKRLGQILPAGVESARLADFSGRPSDGIYE